MLFSIENALKILFLVAREWLLAVCICRKGTHDEKLAWTFRLYDTDGSGSIDFEEVDFSGFYFLSWQSCVEGEEGH